MRQIIFTVFAVFVLLSANSCQTPPQPSQTYNPGGNNTSPNDGSTTNNNGNNNNSTFAGGSQGASGVPVNTNLSVNDFNSVKPQDVQQEVSYEGGFGGGSVCEGQQYSSPTLAPSIMNTPSELLDPIYIDICGLQPTAETVNIRVELPNNSIRNYTEQSDSIGSIDFRYESQVDDPIGTYHFIFTGNNWSLEQDLAINDISSPRLFINGNQLILVKFRPNENVRLFVYKPEESNANLQFVGWKALNVDARGELIINVNYPNGEFVAIGESSGEVDFRYANAIDQWTYSHADIP